METKVVLLFSSSLEQLKTNVDLIHVYLSLNLRSKIVKCPIMKSIVKNKTLSQLQSERILKAARVVNVKLFFCRLILLWFDNTNQLMRETRFFVWKIENFDELQLQYFLLKLCKRFRLTNVYKWMFGIFLILYRSWVIWKNKRRPGLYTLVFYNFINNSRSKQNKKKSWTSICRH